LFGRPNKDRHWNYLRPGRGVKVQFKGQISPFDEGALGVAIHIMH